ncbi:hypothetical protein ADUPG1_000634, partial [Aduncisulcus paluster]
MTVGSFTQAGFPEGTTTSSGSGMKPPSSSAIDLKSTRYSPYEPASVSSDSTRVVPPTCTATTPLAPQMAEALAVSPLRTLSSKQISWFESRSRIIDRTLPPADLKKLAANFYYMKSTGKLSLENL